MSEQDEALHRIRAILAVQAGVSPTVYESLDDLVLAVQELADAHAALRRAQFVAGPNWRLVASELMRGYQ